MESRIANLLHPFDQMAIGFILVGTVGIEFGIGLLSFVVGTLWFGVRAEAGC